MGRWSSRVGERFLDWLDARSDARWLEVGCGTGAFTEQILSLQRPSHLIGVEPSETFLEAAKERVSGERVEFQIGSGENLPVEDACINYAVSGLVLNFVPDKETAMRELLRVLAPGGVAASYVWDYAGHVQFMRYFWDAAVQLNPEAREMDEGVRFPICRPGPLRNLFESAGFRDVQVIPIDVPTPFKNARIPVNQGVFGIPGVARTRGQRASDVPVRLRRTDRSRGARSEPRSPADQVGRARRIRIRPERRIGQGGFRAHAAYAAYGQAIRRVTELGFSQKTGERRRMGMDSDTEKSSASSVKPMPTDKFSKVPGKRSVEPPITKLPATWSLPSIDESETSVSC